MLVRIVVVLSVMLIGCCVRWRGGDSEGGRMLLVSYAAPHTHHSRRCKSMSRQSCSFECTRS